jgi:hypothetical protein
MATGFLFMPQNGTEIGVAWRQSAFFEIQAAYREQIARRVNQELKEC